MKPFKLLVIVFFYVLSIKINAQKDSILQLSELELPTAFSSKNIKIYHNVDPNDTLLSAPNENFKSLLTKHFNLYFKEFGNQMLSSVSVKGTHASQTSVYWNGIPVNSKLNGQTDFSQIVSHHFDAIQFKNSGGSVSLGSGTIGGAINLQNQFNFDDHKSFKLIQEISSFDTYQTLMDVQTASNQYVLNLHINYANSQNDYPFINKNLHNENGQYQLIGGQLNQALRINPNNLLYFRSLVQISDKNISSSLLAANQQHLDYNTQFYQIGWQNQQLSWRHDIKLAYTLENYSFQFQKDNSLKDNNNSYNWYLFSEHLFSYTPHQKVLLGTQLFRTKGIGNQIGTQQINNFAGFVQWEHYINATLQYQVSLRKEYSSTTVIPWLYEGEFDVHITPKDVVTFNFSKNFRLPTLNDLYWKTGGNIDLLPETSHQFSLSYSHEYKSLIIQSEFYYLKGSNFIQWQPTDNNIWQPINVQNTENKGIELTISNIQPSSKYQWKAMYSFTDAKNIATGKQLFYVPYHQAVFWWQFQWKKWNFGMEHQYHGAVYTTSDNKQRLPDYFIQNASVSFPIYKQHFKGYFTANNVLNQYYENVESYPLPGRNLKISVQFNL